MIFQPVLQAYPTRHSWIITAHISLGNLECHWKLFKRQLTRTQQFLRSLEQHPSASTQLLTTLQLELSNIQDIYKSSKTSITWKKIRLHHLPIGEVGPSIKCSHLSPSRCGMGSLETCTDVIPIPESHTKKKKFFLINFFFQISPNPSQKMKR